MMLRAWPAAVSLWLAASVGADVVHQRDGLPALEGRIMRVDDAGITLDRNYAEPDFIRWDRVRDVRTDRTDLKLQTYLDEAAKLWRARTRLERNDAAMAEPLLESLFQRYRGQSNDTALLVAEGLLRCRLARGAQDLAVIPALEIARLRTVVKGSGTAFPTLPSVFDDRTFLCTQLPPVWLSDTTSLVKLERELAAYESGTNTIVASLAAMYLHAVRHQIGMRVDEEQRVLAADHPGVMFLRSIVDAGSSDAMRRNAARLALARELPSLPEWAQAWSSYFIGMSLMAEPGVGRQEQGLVNLSYIPARFAAVQPYLAGVALAKLADACDAWGDASAASSLRTELATRYPRHPALASLRTPASSSQPATAPQAPVEVNSKEPL